MQKKKIALTLILFNLIFYQGLLIQNNFIKGSDYISISSEYPGISHYSMLQNITYEITINWSLNRLGTNSYEFFLKYPLFDNRVPNEFEYTPPIQVSSLIYHSVEGNGTKIISQPDRFGNNYYSFNRTINDFNSDPILINQKYIITLNEIAFETDISDENIGPYNLSDDIHDLYCQAEQFFEMNDPNLIIISNNIVAGLNNPIDKAKAIYDYVIQYLNYDIGVGVEKGALWAYNNKVGDCSEFSNLMITLLRIQGIPARKCTGMILSNSTTTGASAPNYNLKIGDELSYYSNFSKNSVSSLAGSSTLNTLLHAWLEYYVPDIGWIPCDPTWGYSGYSFFNRMDFIHLTSNIGAWFDVPGLSYNISEFFVLPNPIYQAIAVFEYDTLITIKVIEGNLMEDNTLTYIIAISIISIALLVIVYIFIKTGKRKKKQEMLYQSY